jgi:hypothetical protein
MERENGQNIKEPAAKARRRDPQKDAKSFGRISEEMGLRYQKPHNRAAENSS